MEIGEYRKDRPEAVEGKNDETITPETVRLNRKLLVTNCILVISIIINVKLLLG